MGQPAPRVLRRLMASQTSAPPFDQKLHVRRIRAELEARGIWIDDELDDALMEMMRLGREANEAGRPILGDPGYKDAAVRLHRLPKLPGGGAVVPPNPEFTRAPAPGEGGANKPALPARNPR